MNRIFSTDTVNKVGEEVLLKGWVNARRNMGKIAFLDLRDKNGILQVVGVPAELDEKSNEELKKIRLEDLIELRGIVQARGAKQQNPDMPTGMVEILAKEIKTITDTIALPFEISGDTREFSEPLRMKYRYLDLRSERMKNNIVNRHKINLFLRNHFSAQGFTEIETPYLTKGTPEGAREYLVPSRIYKGEFYVLPQSPQQFKQLLMVAGMERYFQIARCFRDEDQRGDRQPEFTQFDMEMSFTNQEEILNLTEEAMIKLVEEYYPEKKIMQKPFPRLTYQDAAKKYKSDKPDLRKDSADKNELAFAWVTDFPMFEESAEEKKLVAVHHPFTRPQEEDVKLLDNEPLKVRAIAYDLVLNGFEVGGGSMRIHERDLQNKIFELLGLEKEEIQSRFGHILEAFTFSPPPHGGLALGLDRLVMLLQGEENIREVMAFPKTSDARDLMMGAPSVVSPKALDDANIKLK